MSFVTGKFGGIGQLVRVKGLKIPTVWVRVPLPLPVYANIAQMVEHSPDKGKVTGSIPVIRTMPVEHGVRPTLIRLVWVDRYHLLVPSVDGRVVNCKGLQILTVVGSNPTRRSIF
jgi:hypothetical protein